MSQRCQYPWRRWVEIRAAPHGQYTCVLVSNTISCLRRTTTLAQPVVSIYEIDRVVRRPDRDDQSPVIRYGLIASGNQVHKGWPAREGVAARNEHALFRNGGGGADEPLSVSGGVNGGGVYEKSFSTLYLEVRSLAHARSARLPRRRVSELAEVCHELPVERKLNSQIPV
jgi:hypothetical protein